jgi:hypothetical protein
MIDTMCTSASKEDITKPRRKLWPATLAVSSNKPSALFLTISATAFPGKRWVESIPCLVIDRKTDPLVIPETFSHAMSAFIGQLTPLTCLGISTCCPSPAWSVLQ